MRSYFHFIDEETDPEKLSEARGNGTRISNPSLSESKLYSESFFFLSMEIILSLTF